jgi:glutamate racemase
MVRSEQPQVRIGLFDSGIGGLSILKDIVSLMPEAAYFYLADHAYAPYGKLTAEQVVQRSEFCTQWLLDNAAVDIMVIACNTATAEAISSLRKKFPQIPFVGVEPYINVINKEQHLFGDNSRVAVLTTPLLAKNPRFLNLLDAKDPQRRIRVVACPGLAKTVEGIFAQGFTDKLKLELQQELLDLNLAGQLDYAILGCTHYPLVAKTLEEMLGARCLGPGLAVARRVVELVCERQNGEKSSADSCSQLVIPTPDSSSFLYFSTAQKSPLLQPRSLLQEWPK